MGFEQAYAAAGKVKHGSYYAMQDMTSGICNNVTVPSEQSTATLVDTRDNNTYTVAKLKDGKCWMTQNLRIVGKTLNAQDSDVISNFSLNNSNLSGFTRSGELGVYLDPSDGGLYTWTAAAAGSSLSSGNAPYSICPKSWHLPSNTDMSSLLSSQGNLYSSPANFINMKYIYSNAISFGAGNYWLSTASSSCGAYFYSSGGVSRSDSCAAGDNKGVGKYFGYYIRCFAD